MSESSTFTVRRAEPGDYEAVSRIFSGPKAVWGTLQVPFPSAEHWRQRLAEPREGLFSLLVCVGDEVIGILGLQTFPTSPRRRHAGHIGMAVRDDWQGRGAGTALMQAAVELAEKWLNITRLELEVNVDNEPAIHLYKKFGFQVEGTLRQFTYRNGENIDVYSMARLRSPARSAS
jgi:L-phenylalanine/L-methionine N-acetyltransferase